MDHGHGHEPTQGGGEESVPNGTDTSREASPGAVMWINGALYGDGHSGDYAEFVMP